MRYTPNSVPLRGMQQFIGAELTRIAQGLQYLDVDTLTTQVGGSRLASQVVVAPAFSTAPAPLIFGVRPAMSVMGPGPDTTTWFTVDNYTADTGAASIFIRKSRNAGIGLQTAVQSGDDTGSLYYYGSDGTNFVSSAAIRATVEGAVSAGVVPGRLSLYTAEITSGTFKEWLRIESSGDLRKLSTGGGNLFSVESSVGNQGIIKLGPNSGANYKYLAFYSAAYAAREAYIGCNGAGNMEVSSEQPGGTMTFACIDAGGTPRGFFIGSTGASLPKLGFFGTAAQSKATITGSRGGNAALASLLTALATYGLIVDSST